MRKFNGANFSHKLIWTTGSCLLLLILAFILPRKGFDFTDHSYYLYNSFLMSKMIFPTEGNAYLPYALLYKLGVWHYYFFELFYFLSLGFSVTVLWSSFKPIKQSLFLPIALVMSLSSNFTYMFSYQHAPFVLLMLGFGSLYHALNKNSRWLAALAAFALGYGATANLALFPTVLTTGLIVYCVARKSPINKIFQIIYWPTAIAFIWLNIVDHLSFFGLNSDPEFSIAVLLFKIPKFIWFLIKANPLAVVFIIIAPYLRNNKRESMARTILLVIMSLMLLWFVGHSWSWQARHHAAQRDLINLTVFYSYIAMMVFVSYFEFDQFFWRISAVFLVAISYLSILSIATLSDFASHMSFAAVTTSVLACLIFEQYCRNPVRRQQFVIVMSLYGMLSVFFFGHYTFRSYPLLQSKTMMMHHKMQGVMENPVKVDLINQLDQVYVQHHCADKLFVAYPSLPFLYYYFEREAPKNQPWVSSTVGYFNQEELISMLNKNKHWCVITAPDFNYEVPDFFAKANHYLARHSRHIKKINPSKVDFTSSKMPQRVVVYIK